MNFSPLNIILIGIAGLLGVGFYGLLITRNLIKVVMMLQILIKAVVLALIFAGKVSGNLGLGQSTAATVIVADTIVAVVGLALAVQVRRRFGTLDVPKISTLKG
ncbi:NADH-quinone oxidoreductase subunit K [Candidatus Villigracilis saccharophilus]|uniref:NADH-quinone oxidoreductase subunit NuoK n=1 Tax=Candidatus Villigracilis saccharophilus TaxID=3140684 RepID=UPI00313495F0|nr:NADH-quinone oxidoreductase subunit K [Anaerolineales bacterium]